MKVIALTLATAGAVLADKITMSTYALNCDCSSTPIDVEMDTGCTNGVGASSSLTCDGAGKITQATFTTDDCSGTALSSVDYTNDECVAVCVMGLGASTKWTGCGGAAPCFGRESEATLANGETIAMSELKSGDYVLPGPTRVIVNQHAKAPELKSALLEIQHADGALKLTPDHVLSVDGKFVAAREAKTGTKLGESEVSGVSSSAGGIINPLTTSGKIMANGVLATTYPEWIAAWALAYPVHLTAGNGVSFLFPATTQSYYDAVLEPAFQATKSSLGSLKTVLPAPLVAVVFIALDLLVSAGLVFYTLASLKVALAMAAVVAMTKSRK